MFRSATASLATLPVEMLHHIFNSLDGTTIFLSVRHVCQHLKTAVQTYNRYALDLMSMFKPDFHRLLSYIRPERVIALTLSDGGATPGQIGLFLLLVNIDLFTRLRSLTLLEINERDLCSILAHARSCSLVSLTIMCSLDGSLHEQIVQLLLSIISQPTLLRLDLLNEQLCDLIDHIEWPTHSKLRYLRMQCGTGQRLSEILDRSSNLERLILGEDLRRFSCFPLATEASFFSLYPYLTSLVSSHCTLSIDIIQSLLSHTPSLTYLKIISIDFYMMDGCRWEDLIKTKLPLLGKFEFLVHFSQSSLDEETTESMLNRVVTPFCTPFWMEEKKWLVTCNWSPKNETAEIFTSPICTFNYLYYSDPNMMSICNFSRQDQHPMILESNDRLLSNVTDLIVILDSMTSTAVFPPILDLCKVTDLTLRLSWNPETAAETLPAHVIQMLRGTPNVQTLRASLWGTFDRVSSLVDDLCLAVIRCVSPSMLRHLEISVSDMNQVQMLLERFRDLVGITFLTHSRSLTTAPIIGYVSTLMRGLSISEKQSAVSIWLGERSQTRRL